MISGTRNATVPHSLVPQILPQAPAVSELPSRLSLLVLGDDSVPLVRGASVTFSRHTPCHGNMGCEGYDPCGDSMEPATLERIAAHNDAGRLNAVDGSAYFATFSALTVLYAAAWIAISNLMRTRMA